MTAAQYQCCRRLVNYPRYAGVWRLRTEGKTLREAGAAFGISGERARQICLKAIRLEQSVALFSVFINNPRLIA